MLIQHIALVPEAAGIDPSEVARVSAALQKQVTRDFSPAWGVHATVDAFPRLADVPAGYWPILITRDSGSDSGVRLDRDGTPYAQVEHSPEWSIAASSACFEMLRAVRMRASFLTSISASPAPPPLPRTSSTAPVSILREPDRASKAGPVMVVAGVLAVAAALALVWRASDASQQAAPRATVTTTMEAATATAPAAAPLPAPAPVVERPKEHAVAAAPAPTSAVAKAKRTKPRASVDADSEPVAHPAADEAKPAPATPAPAAAQAGAKGEPSSIDDLIDTRR